MISELTKVPLGWEKIKFGDIVKNVTDRIDDPKTSGLKDYIGLEHLDTDEIRIMRYGSPDEVEATKFLCKKGDIIFGKRRAYLRKLAVTSRDAVVSAHSMVLRPKEEKVLPEFLPWFMYSSQFWKTAFAISEGSLSPTIKWKTLSAQEFWLPTRNEQRKIAEILWSIESNVEKLEKLMQVVEKLKKGLLEELLTKGVGHKNFEKTELGVIPEGWEVVKIKDVGTIVTGKTPSTKNPSYWGGNIAFVTPTDINEEKNQINTERSITKKALETCKTIPKGSLMVTCIASIGKNAVSNQKCCTNQQINSLIPNPKASVDYLYYYIEKIKPELEQMAGKTAVPILNKSEFEKMKIALPPITEQYHIVKMLNEIYEQKSLYRRHLGYLSNIKKKLINSFLSGEFFIPKEEGID